MKRLSLWVLCATALLLSGCAHLHQVNPQQKPWVYLPTGGPALALRWAPAFVILNPGQSYNRIGSPSAAWDQRGWLRFWVDPARPAIYWQQHRFEGERGTYTNLIYRVHFPAIPWSLVPLFLGAGRNMGLLVVVTLDESGAPVLVTQTGTCGCYTVLIPTGASDPAMLPPAWADQPQDIYGQSLPGRMYFRAKKQPRLVLTVRPGEHRVMAMKVEEAAGPEDRRRYIPVAAPLLPARDLRRLPVAGQDGSASFFYESGPLEGHVKGAWKPLETLLMGVWSFDLAVGMDKAYGVDENPFYTSLKFWARQDSDLNQFSRFMRYRGFRP